MLVLTRKVGEVIRISDDISLMVVSISSGGKVRLGISAPKDVPVHRQELYEVIQREQLRPMETDES